MHYGDFYTIIGANVKTFANIIDVILANCCRVHWILNTLAVHSVPTLSSTLPFWRHQAEFQSELVPQELLVVFNSKYVEFYNRT